MRAAHVGGFLIADLEGAEGAREAEEIVVAGARVGFRAVGSGRVFRRGLIGSRQTARGGLLRVLGIES